jgi:predicted nucleic acid-binding protein
LDAGAIIRWVEGNLRLKSAVDEAMGGRPAVTSVISITECLTGPLRVGDKGAEQTYNDLFAGEDLELLLVNQAVARSAAEIRGRLAMKTPDAIHMATAVIIGAEVFVTADLGFERCRATSSGPEILIVPAI